VSRAPPREAHNTARRPPAALPAHFQPAEVLAQALEALEPALEALEPALEVLDTVDENLCTPAKPLIIVKTLNRTRANKGFYYDENHCKPATHLDTPQIDVCTPANIDGPCDIDHPTPVIEGCKPRETHCTPLEDHCRPATRLATPREAPGTSAVGPSPPGCHPAATGRHFQLIGTSFAQKLVRVW